MLFTLYVHFMMNGQAEMVKQKTKNFEQNVTLIYSFFPCTVIWKSLGELKNKCFVDFLSEKLQQT